MLLEVTKLLLFCDCQNNPSSFPLLNLPLSCAQMFICGAFLLYLSDINSQVTITIKTFLRYNNLKVLLSSIRKFYPEITVIIADDSFEPQKVLGKNIQQYIMPPAQVTKPRPISLFEVRVQNGRSLLDFATFIYSTQRSCAQ